MAKENQLSRYGAIAKTYAAANPQAKIFFVAPSTADWFGDFQQLFPADSDGVVRVHSTINAALDACVAGRGDVILALPGFTQNITAAAGIAFSKAGVSLIGLGSGTLRPTINFTTATTADMDIDAANITIENFILDLTGVDALVAPIDVNATDFTMRKCLVVTADAAGQATLGILTDANASRMRLEDNQFLGTTDAGTAAAVRIVGGDEHVIKGNLFMGAYTTSLGAIDNVTTACLRTQVDGNTIANMTASSTKAMVFVSTSTPFITNNRLQILSGTAPITAAAGFVGGNYYVAAAGVTAGTLV